MTELNDKFYEELEKKIQPYFIEVNPCHDITHSYRVMNLGLKIGEIENANLEIIKITALLHDIGRRKEESTKGKICHAQEGAKLTRIILEEFYLEEDLINAVVHGVEAHRFRKKNPPKTIEAKAIYDADKLDAIGMIGILRAASFSGFFGAKVHNPEVDITHSVEYGKEDSAYREYLVKLSKIPSKLLTQEGKKIGKGRYEFMKKAFERANKEYIGEL